MSEWGGVVEAAATDAVVAPANVRNVHFAVYWSWLQRESLGRLGLAQQWSQCAGDTRVALIMARGAV